jgi:hypothetical protein
LHEALRLHEALEYKGGEIIEEKFIEPQFRVGSGEKIGNKSADSRKITICGFRE